MANLRFEDKASAEWTFEREQRRVQAPTVDAFTVEDMFAALHLPYLLAFRPTVAQADRTASFRYLNVFDIPVATAPNGHLAMCITKWPQGGFPRDSVNWKYSDDDLVLPPHEFLPENKTRYAG